MTSAKVFLWSPHTDTYMCTCIPSHTCEHTHIHTKHESKPVFLWFPFGTSIRTQETTRTYKGWNSLCEMTECLCIIYIHPHFKSPLDRKLYVHINFIKAYTWLVFKDLVSGKSSEDGNRGCGARHAGPDQESQHLEGRGVQGQSQTN